MGNHSCCGATNNPPEKELTVKSNKESEECEVNSQLDVHNAETASDPRSLKKGEPRKYHSAQHDEEFKNEPPQTKLDKSGNGTLESS